MINEMPHGASASKEQAKSPEELRFEKLAEDARHRPLEGNYAFVETEEDEQEVHKRSMRGAYWESDDPEKMAMFTLVGVRNDLEILAISLKTLAKWDETQKRKSYIEQAMVVAKGWKKRWERDKDERIAKLQPILSELGLSVPQTAEDAKALKAGIISFKNSQKLAEKYKIERDTK